MTVEEGHVLNIDGSASTIQASGGGGGNNGAKYKPVNTAGDRITSGVGRNSLFNEGDDGFGASGSAAPMDDRVSVLSGASGRSKTTSQLEAAAKLPWYKGITCKDIRDITPTLLILLGGLLIMIFVIPYAFSSVIKQLEASEALEKAQEMARQLNMTKAIQRAAEKAKNATATTLAPQKEDGGGGES